MKINLTLILIFNSIILFSQTGVIKGRVYDELNNDKLPYVNVLIQGTTLGATSDENGNFLIPDLTPGIYRLSISFIGYKNIISDEIQVTNSSTPYIEIGMIAEDTQIGEVTVSTNSNSGNKENPVSFQRIELSDIEYNPGSNRDIAKVIQSFPGVAQSVSFRNDIIIRGGGPSESRYYLDGVEIPNLNHFATQGASGGPVGILNADFISGVNYFSGGFPANRSNALSGVFEFSQKDGNKDKMKVRASIGASDFALTLDGPLSKNTSYIFSVRQSYLQFLFDAIGLPFLPTFNDYQIKTKTRINEHNELSIISIGALDKFKLNLGIEEPTLEQEYILNYLPVNNQWNYAIGGVYKHFMDNSYQTIVLSRNMLNNESYKYYNNDDSSEDNLIQNYLSQEIENKFRFENTTRLNGYKINAGISLEHAKYNNSTYQKLFIANELFTVDYASDVAINKYGAFGQVSKSWFKDKLSGTFGLRMDGNDYSDEMKKLYNKISPRLSLSYTIFENLSLNMNTGRYYQLPAYTTLGFRDNNGFLVNKQNNIDYIRCDHFITGFEYRYTENSHINVEGFIKNYENYPFSVVDGISLANKGADFGSVGAEEVTSTGTGRAYGFEISGNAKTKKGFSILASYTFVRSEFADLNGVYVPSSWDNKHLYTMTVGQKLPKNWNIGFKWRFMGGAPYTPYDMETSAVTQAWDLRQQAYFDYNRLNSERLKPFHQLDIRIDKKYYFRKWSLMLYADVQNAYNFKGDSPGYVIVDTDENGNALYQDADKTKYQLKTIESLTGTVLPTIGIMVEF